MSPLLAVAILASALGTSPAAPAARPAGPAAIEAPFAFKLATSTGLIQTGGAALSYDRAHGEVLVVSEGLVRVFNAAGMELYSFGDDPSLDGTFAAASDGKEGYVLLCFPKGRPVVHLVNFRGEIVESIPVQIPPDLVDFGIATMGYAGGEIFLSDLGGMRVAVFDLSGKFLRIHDIAKAMGVSEKQRRQTGLRAVRITSEGDILFTVQPLFKAGVMTRDGKVETFGTPGGAPGKFNIVSGIDRDDDGLYYVTDMLKSAVLVFDRDFHFLREFGYRGDHPGALWSPTDVVVGGGQIFVSQRVGYGVSVFRAKPIFPGRPAAE